MARKAGSTTGTSGNYKAGDIVSITAVPATGYIFSSWTTNNGGTFANANNAITAFTMPHKATTITANFTLVIGQKYAIVNSKKIPLDVGPS